MMADDSMASADTSESAVLANENEALRQRLKELEATELYLEARKKLMQLIAVVLVVITAFGVVSVKSLTASIRDELRANATESIIDQVKTQLVRSYSAEIDRQVSQQLSESVASEIQTELLSLAREALAEAETNSESDFAETVVRSYVDRQFYVVISSSPDVSALRRLAAEYGGTLGSQLTNRGLNLWLCQSIWNPNWGLTLGPPMPLEHAQQVVREATIIGIPQQSYPGRVSRLKCEELHVAGVRGSLKTVQNTPAAVDASHR